MGKKKNKHMKFKPADLNNLPSSSTKTVKTPNNINTSSELSVTSSKESDSIDNISVQFGKMLNEPKNDIVDDSCKPLRNLDDDHKAYSESRSNTNKDSTTCIITERYSDEVISNLQHVTIDSQNTSRSDSSDHLRKKTYNDMHKTKSYHNSAKHRNYPKNTSNDFYKGDRPNQRDHYTQKNQNKYDSANINDSNFATKSSNNFNKNDRSNYRREHNKYEYKKSHEYRIRSSNTSSPVYNYSTSGPWKEHPSEEIPSIRNNSFIQEYPLEQNKQENWDEDSQNVQGEQENWNEISQNEQRTVVENEPTSSKDDSAWDDDLPGTELNAGAKAFVPILPGKERTEIVKTETAQTEYTTGDDSYDRFTDNYWHKPERSYQEKEQRGSLEKKQYRRNYHSGDWKARETSHYPKRYSEGNNWEKKENSSPTTRQNIHSLDTSYEKVDVEYRKFRDEERNNDKIEFVRVVEMQQDLFAMGNEYSLAHCVAEDLRMGSGIAVTFKRDFKDIDILLNQRQKQGGLAILENETDQGVRYIYYLITKRKSVGKPTYETLWSSLQKMRDHIKEQNVKKLAIPRLGCGLDRLEWTTVKHMIEFLFKDVEVEITVCNFQQNEDAPEKPLIQPIKIVNVKKPIADIEEETTIIYLSTEDGDISTEMEQLSKKFSFLDEFKRSPKHLGDLIKYKVPNKYYVLYGCIVRKTKKDPFDFVSFRKCISQIDKNSKKEEYFYIAIQAIKDDNDNLINDKLVTILRNYLHRMELYVCWDGDLVDQMLM